LSVSFDLLKSQVTNVFELGINFALDVQNGHHHETAMGLISVLTEPFHFRANGIEVVTGIDGNPHALFQVELSGNVAKELKDGLRHGSGMGGAASPPDHMDRHRRLRGLAVLGCQHAFVNIQQSGRLIVGVLLVVRFLVVRFFGFDDWT